MALFRLGSLIPFLLAGGAAAHSCEGVSLLQAAAGLHAGSTTNAPSTTVGADIVDIAAADAAFEEAVHDRFHGSHHDVGPLTGGQKELDILHVHYKDSLLQSQEDVLRSGASSTPQPDANLSTVLNDLHKVLHGYHYSVRDDAASISGDALNYTLTISLLGDISPQLPGVENITSNLTAWIKELHKILDGLNCSVTDNGGNLTGDQVNFTLSVSLLGTPAYQLPGTSNASADSDGNLTAFVKQLEQLHKVFHSQHYSVRSDGSNLDGDSLNVTMGLSLIDGAKNETTATQGSVVYHVRLSESGPNLTADVLKFHAGLSLIDGSGAENETAGAKGSVVSADHVRLSENGPNLTADVLKFHAGLSPQ